MAILLPFERRIDWAKPPVVTLALILINCFVYFGIQSGDNGKLDAAFRYYFHTDLPKIEFPAYAKYLDGIDPKKAVAVRNATKKKDWTVLIEIQRDAPFLKALNNSKIIKPDNPAYAKWKKARTHFNTLFNAPVSTRYSLHPNHPITYLTSMFLHGGLEHLLGNMVFLFIVGFGVERIIGGIRFLASYLIAGLVAGALWGFVYPHESALGASGAISGVISMYAVLFGFRKIRFFYWILFYFDYVKAPAWILLPFWIGLQFVGIYFGSGRIAYVDHIGGLLSGALLGLIHKRVLRASDEEYLDEPVKAEHRLQTLHTAQEHMQRLEYGRARPLFEQLLNDNPADLDALIPLYHIYRQTPESEHYHATARKILFEGAKGPDHLKQAGSIFNDYSTHARPGLQLSADELLGLANRFAKGGLEAEAERIVVYLLRKNPRLSGLPESVFLLADTFRRSGKTEKFKRYAALVVQGYPHSPAAVTATKILKLAQA